MLYKVNEENKVALIDIDNECGLKAQLCSFGAGVYSLKFNDRRMILEPKTLDDYKFSTQYFGKSLGVVAGRFKKDGLLLGREYSLVNEPGVNFCLHGGHLKSISFKNWKYKIKETNKKLDVIFNVKTKDGENGFPGGSSIFAIYTFIKGKNEFRITYKATTPDEATFMNLTNHMYFNLDDNDISEHKLKMNASTVAVTDENLFIYSSKPVSSMLDFNKLSKMNVKLNQIEKKDFKKTIDDTFIFDGPGKIVLTNKDTILNIATDNPALNIYVDNSLSDMKFKNENISSLRRGIALETQKWILDRNSLILKHGEVYKQTTIYKFKKK